MPYINVADIVEKNGKTIRENNMERKHGIPCGTLVEVKYDRWHGDGACEKVHARLWVVEHTRDCDGTPLYSLSGQREPNLDMFPNEQIGKAVWNFRSGFAEDDLIPVEITDDIKRGVNNIEWPRDTKAKELPFVNGIMELGE